MINSNVLFQTTLTNQYVNVLICKLAELASEIKHTSNDNCITTPITFCVFLHTNSIIQIASFFIFSCAATTQRSVIKENN